MNQPDLFFAIAAPLDEPAARRTTPSERRALGRQLADEGAQRAADAAGEAFQREAVRYFATYVMNAGRLVTMPEVRLASAGTVRAVKESRAWGQIPKIAAREGYVTFGGYLPSPDPVSHSRPCGAWRWTGKAP